VPALARSRSQRAHEAQTTNSRRPSIAPYRSDSAFGPGGGGVLFAP